MGLPGYNADSSCDQILQCQIILCTLCTNVCIKMYFMNPYDFNPVYGSKKTSPMNMK